MNLILAIVFAVLVAVALVDAVSEGRVEQNLVTRATRGSWKWKAIAAAVVGFILVASYLTG